eukprot:XP_011663489.1 PREDICTED: probable G-protein coupled receptor CG31760 [Strongylocentrotus purpuratus]
MEEADYFHFPYMTYINYTFGLMSTNRSPSTIQPTHPGFSAEPATPCTSCNVSRSSDMFGTDVDSTPSPGGTFAEDIIPNTLTPNPYPPFNSTDSFTSGSSAVAQIPHDATDSSKTVATDATETGTYAPQVNTANADRVPDVSEDPAPATPSQVPILDTMKFVDITDGYWTKPYFDCGGGDVWMVTFSVPFFWSDMNPSLDNPSGIDLFTFAGVTTIDISLDQLDIYQCPSNDRENSEDGEIFDPFVDTHRCKNTTQCLHISGQGFQRGAYLCECKPGYYFPPDAVSHTDDIQSPAFLGRTIEEEYNKKAYGLENEYDSAFDCLPCQPGCDECDDDSPCVVEPIAIMRWCFVAVNILCLVLLVVLGIYTYRHREIRVFKAASPGLLYVILLGSGLCYCETIISIAVPLGIVSCQGLLWFRYLGFCLAYGALLFKTWRITKVFTVRSAKPVRITDNNLFLRIGILLAIFVVFLSAWTFLSPSKVKQNYNRAGLKYFECSQNAWNYVGQAGELLLLAWGMYLCFKVRKAPSSFNESRYISVSIYNEALISIFGGIVSFVIPAELSGPDTLLIVNFCRLHATFTVMVALLFVSKIVLFYKTNTDKKKTGDRRSQIVFTIDNSSVTIDFSRENPDVSEELSRLRNELVDIKEIAKLVPVDPSIINRYKLAITSFSTKRDSSGTASPSSVYHSRSDIIAHEHVPEATSGTSTPPFLKKGQKTGANGIAKMFLKSLGSTSSTGTFSVSVGSLKVDSKGGIDAGTAQTFVLRNEGGVIIDDNDGDNDEAGIGEVRHCPKSLNKESTLEEVGGHWSGVSGCVDEPFNDTVLATVHEMDNKTISFASGTPSDHAELKRTPQGDDIEQESMSPLEIFASVLVERILKDSINLAENYSNENSISSKQTF